MKELVFCLEEPSAKAMLEGLLPKLLPEQIPVRYMVFEGKQDLEKRLMPRMRHYRNQKARFIVMRDQDSGDCKKIKKGLSQLCAQAGRTDAMVRIACHELESFYLADLAAVEKGLGISKLASQQNNRKFRAPDNLGAPSLELQTLTHGQYQKISGSRAIGVHLDPDNDRSISFRALVSAIRRSAA